MPIVLAGRLAADAVSPATDATRTPLSDEEASGIVRSLGLAAYIPPPAEARRSCAPSHTTQTGMMTQWMIATKTW